MHTGTRKILLKVCGITRQEDATACQALGVDFCGFVFHPASPRYVKPEQVATLETGSCKRVGVFTTQDAAEILRIMSVARLDFAQLHARQGEEVVRAIGPNRVIRVHFPSPDGLGCTEGTEVAFTLFDSGYGTGKAFDWRLLSEARRPYFVAGGLSAGNIPALLAVCRPDGVDVNSGVEIAPGIKSAERIQEIKELL